LSVFIFVMKQFEGAKQQFGTAALTNFFQNVMYPLSLLQKGFRPNSKQLIFEKKFRKSKKKIQRPILVTFNYQITDLDIFSDYFPVF